MPTIPCPYCKRQISDQAKRCLYCGKPLDPAEAEGAAKRAQMLAALYGAGVGLPAAPKSSRLEKMRDEPFLVRLLVAVLIMPVVLFWPPLAWRWMKVLLRP